MYGNEFGILALFYTCHNCIGKDVLKEFSVNLILLLCKDTLFSVCVDPVYFLYWQHSIT